MNVHRLRPVTNLHTRMGYQADYAALARNRICTARTSAGLSPSEFAAMLSQLVGRPITGGIVKQWETEATPPGDVLVAVDGIAPVSSERCGVRSHKFVAAHVGPDAALRFGDQAEVVHNVVEGLDCYSMRVEHQSGQCDLYVWPFGSAIFHLVEDLELSSIATLALWRFQSYEENLAWATAKLRALTGYERSCASYVLSLYWVHAPVWVGRPLNTALRLICAPRILLDREIQDAETCRRSAERAERTLLGENYEGSGLRSFGLRGVSLGFASWSGVAFHPLDPGRALGEHELISLELALQAVWCYCEFVKRQLEEGTEPVIAEGYGWRFLRAIKLRLMNPQPQETGQHQAMREAIVETSRLPGLLSQALEALREDGK
jgi:hypothetical protein